MEITKEVEEKLKLLNEKYAANGQDVLAYLDGLLYQDYVKYWDYIELDTLLSLQKPRTNFADEEIFIIYHQITELYFKLCLNELKLISNKETISAEFFLERLSRVTRYFSALIDSFEIMSKGMDNTEFMKFRMALLPASGFQSAQYRLIEFHCTDLKNLVHVDQREALAKETNLETLYENVYWKEGAKDLATKKKTLTLIQFEEQYEETFLKYTKHRALDNLWQSYLKLSDADQKNPEIIEELRKLDQAVNVNWPLSHYKSAVRYLQTKEGDVNATGGTNWQKYLPPRFQKRVFFPTIWSEEEIDIWGKAWVENTLL
ncbi:tryptophan 2,3-dioxygenase family protein [Crocinitomicaceae bacterium]|jgi:tryptophan 2,3-dioxygenase|nr:tryptophan 2,3-dioxygenase family protein [Crocinitomicaceae bacterium]MDG1345978.1 tryptophan 2,3-dioxygenase family protein [Crocinitomicaceae bacterium]